MSERIRTIRHAVVVFLVGLIPAIGIGASVAMVAVIFLIEYSALAPVCGLICGLVVRFVTRSRSVTSALVACALTALAFTVGAVMRGALRIAIEMSERPPDVIAKLDWSLAAYLVMASLRSNRWWTALLAIGVAFFVVKTSALRRRRAQ